ncbi:MAG: Fe-S protein assembly chaperone HscA [Capsulimonadales bacterium]|nr:Fe-S protein assembly chaperone HscA [Capsulimonadales bacterium]
MSMIVGIDLGTTNSLVACMEKGVPVVIRDPETQAALLPSVVHFPEGEERPVVGDPARPFLTTHPLRTIFSAKRLMGRGPDDLRNEAELLPYRLSTAYAETVRIDLGDGRAVSAPEVGALVLRALRERAERVLGQPVEKAVITVPAYFNDAQRQATKDAGTIAGLEVVRIVNEPTAASLAYGLQNRDAATIAVFDLGGGTFDISLLRLEDGIFEVLATGGDTHLGGDDIDNLLVESLLAEMGETNVSAELRGLVRLAAEAAKRRLTDHPVAVVTLERPGGGTFARTLDRAELERAIAPLIGRTLAACRQVLADADLRPDQIDEVVLVGGSTRIPAIREAVGNLFGRVPHTHLNPDEVVALGAAIQADILSGNRTDLLLLDITPLSLGLETMGGATEKLIFRNAKIPSTAKEEFTTSIDGQTTVLLHVVQGEREMAGDNRSLARLELSGIPPMPAGIPKIEVTFLLDANGILQVNAVEVRSGVRTEVRIKPSYGLTENEVRTMVRESFRFAEDDFKARMIADMRNEAEAAIRGANKLLASHGADLDRETREKIEEALGRLVDARDRAPDHSAIREAMEAFEATARPLAELAMSGVARELVGGKTLAEAEESLNRRREKTEDAHRA